jgi:hypothetical protein
MFKNPFISGRRREPRHSVTLVDRRTPQPRMRWYS